MSYSSGVSGGPPPVKNIMPVAQRIGHTIRAGLTARKLGVAHKCSIWSPQLSSELIADKMVERVQIIRSYTKKSVDVMTEEVAVLEQKRISEEDKLRTGLKNYRDWKLTIIEELKEKYNIQLDDEDKIKKELWKLMLSSTSETRETIFTRLKNIKILNGLIEKAEYEIDILSTKYQQYFEEVCGKRRVLTELDQSIENLLRKINYVDRKIEEHKKSAAENILTLKTEMADLNQDTEIDSEKKRSLLDVMQKKVDEEKDKSTKYLQHCTFKKKEMNYHCIIRYDLMKKVFDIEMEELKVKRKAKLNRFEMVQLRKQMDKVRLLRFCCELNDLERQERMATTRRLKDRIAGKITAIKKSINTSGGFRYEGNKYFYDGRGRCYYMDANNRKIYKDNITSTLLYQLDSLGNLVLITTGYNVYAKLKLQEINLATKVADQVEKEYQLEPEDRTYLKEHLFEALRIGLAQVTMVRPNDPVAYLAHFLLMKKRGNITGLFKPEFVSEVFCLQSQLHDQVISMEKKRSIRTILNQAQILDPKTPVIDVGCSKEFNDLNEREKRYTYYLYKVNTVVKMLLSVHVSAQSPILLILFHKIFVAETVPNLRRNLIDAGFQNKEINGFLLFVAAVVSGSGNYRRVCRQKMMASIPEKVLEKIFKTTVEYKNDPKTMDYLIKLTVDNIYTPAVRSSIIGTHSLYITQNITAEDLQYISDYLGNDFEYVFNKRIIKKVEGNHIYYDIQIQSILMYYHKHVIPTKHLKEGCIWRTFSVSHGHSAGLLRIINEYLQKALYYANYKCQRYYLKNMINYFTTGSVSFYRKAMSKMILTEAPIEIYFGCLQHWHDDGFDVGEFGSIITLQSKTMKARYEILTRNLPVYVDFLPWSSEFEKTIFKDRHRISFVNVLDYASCSLQTEFIIPCQPSIRKLHGVRDIFMTNFLNTKAAAEFEYLNYPFLTAEDTYLYQTYFNEANLLFTDLIATLGLKSGKLLRQTERGYLNFDKNLKDPTTNAPITKYYKFDETFESKFGDLALPLKYVRAGAIALYSSLNMKLYEDLHIPNGKELIYVMWLSLAYNGLVKTLHDYNFETNTWTRVSLLAYYIIMRYLLEEGNDKVFYIVETVSPQSNTMNTMYIKLNNDNIYTHGKEILKKFILEINIVKATGDVERGTEIIKKWSSVPFKGKYPIGSWYCKYIKQWYSKLQTVVVTPTPFFKKAKKQKDIDNKHLLPDCKAMLEHKKIVDYAAALKRIAQKVETQQEVNELHHKTAKLMTSYIYDDTNDDEEESENELDEVMPNDGKVKLKSYPNTAEGAINSFVDNLDDLPGIDFVLEEIWASVVPSFAPHIVLNPNPIEQLRF